MEIVESKNLKGLIKIIPDVYKDKRGNFFELYNDNFYSKFLFEKHFPQDNVSFSTPSVLRGLHFQLPPFDQGKLVTCLNGFVYDVAVDLRKNSPTFGKWEGFVLDGESREQIWIPSGFAHGFRAITSAVIHYKVTQPYKKEYERTLIWNDPDVNITWSVDGYNRPINSIISEKDMQGKTLKELESEL